MRNPCAGLRLPSKPRSISPCHALRLPPPQPSLRLLSLPPAGDLQLEGFSLLSDLAFKPSEEGSWLRSPATRLPPRLLQPANHRRPSIFARGHELLRRRLRGVPRPGSPAGPSPQTLYLRAGARTAAAPASSWIRRFDKLSGL